MSTPAPAPPLIAHRPSPIQQPNGHRSISPHTPQSSLQFNTSNAGFSSGSFGTTDTPAPPSALSQNASIRTPQALQSSITPALLSQLAANLAQNGQSGSTDPQIQARLALAQQAMQASMQNRQSLDQQANGDSRSSAPAAMDWQAIAQAVNNGIPANAPAADKDAIMKQVSSSIVEARR